MKQPLLLSCGKTAALEQACSILKASGFSFADKPEKAVTHLLLPVPSFDTNGSIKGGGDLCRILAELPKDITIIGGNLQAVPEGYGKWDLLRDDLYVSKNAAITAHCALRLAMGKLPCVPEDCPVLVIGWGRIGKCLARSLRQLGARVVVAARKEKDRAMLQALGYTATDTANLDITDFRVVFNTVPELLLPDCEADALLIDLASSPGITGKQVIRALALPGKDAPESSGKLIAQTIIRYYKEAPL